MKQPKITFPLYIIISVMTCKRRILRGPTQLCPKLLLNIYQRNKQNFVVKTAQVEKSEEFLIIKSNYAVELLFASFVGLLKSNMSAVVLLLASE